MRTGIQGAGAGEQEIDDSVLLRKTEVAQLLKVSVRTVENLTARGAIPAPIRLGKFSPRWVRADLIAALGGLQGPTAGCSR